MSVGEQEWIKFPEERFRVWVDWNNNLYPDDDIPAESPDISYSPDDSTLSLIFIENSEGISYFWLSGGSPNARNQEIKTTITTNDGEVLTKTTPVKVKNH